MSMDNREQFKLLVKKDYPRTNFRQWEFDGQYMEPATQYLWEGYQMRQAEIDAKDKVIDDLALEKGILKAEIGRLKAEITRYQATLKRVDAEAEAAMLPIFSALKDEAERLRKDAERLAILLREFMYCEVQSQDEITEGNELLEKYKPAKERHSCPHNNKECVYESDDGESERWHCRDCGERWSVEIPQ